MKYYTLFYLIILLFILLTTIFLFTQINTIEQFDPMSMATTWSPKLIKQFQYYQDKINNNIYQYNYEQLQQQATPQEAKFFLNKGFWKWDNNLKNEYIDKIKHNQIVKISPQEALNNAQKIYNQKAMQQKIGWNTKEGQFLLYGAHHNGVTFKCKNNGINKIPSFVSYDKNNNIQYIEHEQIPNKLKGFSFVKKPCNPCSAINNIYSCPFEFNVQNKPTGISKIWKILWNLHY